NDKLREVRVYCQRLSTPYPDSTIAPFRYDKMDKTHIVRCERDSNALACRINGFLQRAAPDRIVAILPTTKSITISSLVLRKVYQICKMYMNHAIKNSPDVYEHLLQSLLLPVYDQPISATYADVHRKHLFPNYS